MNGYSVNPGGSMANRRAFMVGVAAASSLPATRASGQTATTTSPSRGRAKWYRTAGEQVTDLANGRVSAVELLDQAIARIDRLDTQINAVVVRDFDRARSAAIAADQALARGERRPLLGLPMTVKESYNVVGLPTTWGIPAQRDFTPTEDALPVARVKDAGVDYELRGLEKPSDHAPIWLELS